MAENRAFRHHVENIDGYVLEYPNIGVDADLIQGYPPNPYACTKGQEFPLGTKLIQGERVWRYCQADSTEIAIGKVLQSPALNHASQGVDIKCNAIAAIGATEVQVRSTANIDTGRLAELDGLAEGYFVVTDGAGQGQCYKIKGNDIFATTGTPWIRLYDPLTVATAVLTSKCGIIENPYSHVVVSAAVCTAMVVGVAPITVTASYYFWSQTGGPAGVIAGGTMVVGTWAIVGTNAGTAGPAAALTTEVVIGYPITKCDTATETFACFLTLDR